MSIRNWKKYIKKSKKDYKSIGYVECPAFSNDKIYFNKHGFRHLLRKGQDVRPISEQVRRLNLLGKVPKILKVSEYYLDYRVVKDAQFWSISQKHGKNRSIIIIIRQIKNGPKHFFSVMDKRIP